MPLEWGVVDSDERRPKNMSAKKRKAGKSKTGKASARKKKPAKRAKLARAGTTKKKAQNRPSLPPPPSRGISAAITGNFDCRHYNALKEGRSLQPPGISTGWAFGGVPQ